KRWLLAAGPPALLGGLALAAWEAFVRLRHVPPYILPGPLRIAAALGTDGPLLLPALGATLAVTAEALAAAAVVGGGLAVVIAQARWLERSLSPFAVVLQVPPLVATAPLLLIWVKNVHLALALCAFLVAFFPVVSNTALGLRSADPRLLDLLRL